MSKKPKTSFKQMLASSSSNPLVNLQGVRQARQKVSELKRPAAALGGGAATARPSAKRPAPASAPVAAASAPQATAAAPSLPPPPRPAPPSTFNFLPANTFQGKRLGYAYKTREMPSDITDSELLDAYRQKQWDANARWQLSTFAQSHLGAWSGSLALYRPERRADGTIGFVESASHSSATSVEALVAEDGCVRWKEALGLDPTTPLDSSGDLTYASFDRYAGCSAVGGAYTLMRKREGGRLLFEIGMREEGQRVRCKFVYKPAPDRSDDLTPDQTPVELEELAIIREALGEGAAYAPAVSSAGGGLYDPPPLADRTDYCSLYCTGGLTLVFPARCDAAAPGFLSADWISGRMRYQADRKFQKLDGTLSSLELSEIQTEDAERFPSEKTQPGR